MLANPPAQFPLDDRAVDLFTALASAGDLSVELVTYACAGELDPRLAVRRAPDLVVEILCDQGLAFGAPCWNAVRVTGDSRSVWRGPPRDAATPAVVRFVDDLLRLAPGMLARFYRLLG